MVVLVGVGHNFAGDLCGARGGREIAVHCGGMMQRECMAGEGARTKCGAEWTAAVLAAVVVLRAGMWAA